MILFFFNSPLFYNKYAVDSYADCDITELLHMLSFSDYEFFVYDYYFEYSPETPMEPDPMNYRTKPNASGEYIYNKYPADDVDKILRTAFGIETINHESVNDITTDNNGYAHGIYYYDGYYYFIGTPLDVYKTYLYCKGTTCEKIDNSEYCVSVNYIVNNNESYYAGYKVVVRLKLIDGERQWTLISTSCDNN